MTLDFALVVLSLLIGFFGFLSAGVIFGTFVVAIFAGNYKLPIEAMKILGHLISQLPDLKVNPLINASKESIEMGKVEDVEEPKLLSKPSEQVNGVEDATADGQQ